MFESIKIEFNEYLSSLYKDDEINEMIAYSLVNNGKRMRPMLFFSILKGFNIEISRFFDLGAAIEMVHTYSLVHDDLPAMDNDDYRHGKLSAHKKYGEANAILVGDALLTDAFAIISNSKNISDQIKVILIKELSDAIGSNGMVRGQFYDLINDNNSSTYHILDINYLKTTKLLAISFIFALYVAGQTIHLNKFLEICDDIGLAFQIQDDILDYEGNFENLGKTPLKDAKSNKKTYVNQFGLEKSKEKVNLLFENAFKNLNEINNFNNEYLSELIYQIKNRRK